MRELGANAIRTFTVPPQWLLDLALEYGIAVLVGLPWAEHVCFLEDRAGRAARSAPRSRDGVERCQRHPAIFAYLVGNEIPPDIVRWLGPERVQAFLEELATVVKAIDPQALVSYANFPPTEYLDLDQLDFVCFNVYLHREPDFRRYLLRLQNLAGDKPLVLTEFGVDSMREGRDGQAAILAWQTRAAFELGVAGTSIFSWTDDWFTGGFQVEDWAFGLVDRERNRKPAFQEVQRIYRAELPIPPPAPPKISVVICAYNAERTMQAVPRNRCARCATRTTRSSSSTTARRTARWRSRSSFPRCASSRRRTGASARRATSASKRRPARSSPSPIRIASSIPIGSPISPTASSTAASSPSAGPTCRRRRSRAPRRAWRRRPAGRRTCCSTTRSPSTSPAATWPFGATCCSGSAGSIRCFAPPATTSMSAGACRTRGTSSASAPAAMVWHFRRNTVQAPTSSSRWATAPPRRCCYFKHPYRFNLLGQSKWLGRIYGDLEHSLFLRRPVIYYGTFGRSLFQTLYEAPASVFAFLPFTLEWNVVAAVLLLGCGRRRSVRAVRRACRC